MGIWLDGKFIDELEVEICIFNHALLCRDEIFEDIHTFYLR